MANIKSAPSSHTLRGKTAIIGAGIIPAGLEMMDRLAIQAAEAFVHAGYPLDAEAMLIIEVEGSEAEQDDLLGLALGLQRRADGGLIWGAVGLHGGLVGGWFVLNQGLIGQQEANPIGSLLAWLPLLLLLWVRRRWW